MRQTFLVLFFIILAFDSSAQVGNEWINFSQSFYKIPTAKEGIYRLNYSDLIAAGLPASAVDPRQLQLFHRGVEQAIWVEGEGDGQLNPGDFIEFYGERNDGTLDAELYKPSSAQPHKYYNLYTDTTHYFLTIGGSPGKRMAAFYEANTNSLSAEPYHWDEKLLLWTNEYSTGVDYGEILNTHFDVGEGWTSGKIFQTQSVGLPIPGILNTLTSSATPELEVLLVGRGTMGHQIQLYAGTGQRLLTTHNFSGFEPQKLTLPIQWSDIDGAGTLPIQLKVNGVGGEPDRVSIFYMKLIYPQKFDLAGYPEKVFMLPENVGNKSFIQIQNPLPGLRLYDITDPTSVSRIEATLNGTFDAIIPGTTTIRKLFASTLTLTPSIKSVTFRQINPSQHDYVIIGHPTLRRSALGYGDPIKAYADYRASAAGGSYDTLVVNIGQLYDQFSYGETSPLAVFNFLKFLAGVKMPKYLLLVGKGLDVNGKYYRDSSPFPIFKDLVPPAGYPASDIAFSAGLGDTDYEPAIPTGRIPAIKAEDVAAYLNKVKEMEALPFDNLWRKNVLHLSGGREEGEPELLKSYLEDLSVVAQDFHLGGKVTALAKYSKEIQVVNVSKQVNEGVNLITFFGHSSATNLDFDIGYVTNPVMGYGNKGKYPTLLMNGCNVGAYFLNGSTFGEDWLLARDKGAIAFIAHSSYGFRDLLKRYADHFYNVGYQDSTFIYRGIGDIQKEAGRKYMSSTVNSPPNITQVQQMILLGDPAVKLFGAPKADLAISNDHVSIESLDGQPITSLTQAFGIKLIVKNFGQAKPGTTRIEVTRTLSDNSTVAYDSLFPITKYTDTLLMVIRKGREQGAGTNGFKITIDPDSVISELTKENNVAVKDFVIPLNGTKNLYPTHYSIVNKREVGFSFQTTDLLSGERSFIFELDTVNTFDSPYRTQTTVTGKVLARLSKSLLDTDTLAYFWRTKLANPSPEESADWATSSFTCINGGPEGWAQVHFSQFSDNQTTGLIKDASVKRIAFKETVTDVSIKTFGSNHAAPNTDVSIKINNEEYNLTQQGFGCRDNSINLIAFDKNSAVPYIGVKFKWYNRGNRACGREPWVINNYVPGDMVTGDGLDLIQFVENVQDGDSVVLFSIGDAQYSAWPAAAKTKLGELGISTAQIDGLSAGEPIVVFARKGLIPGTATIYKSSSTPVDLQQLDVNQTITGRYSFGSMTSGLIGPAYNWQSLISKSKEVEASDMIAFDVVGIKFDGAEKLLLSDVTGDQSLTDIEATEFPYIKIVVKNRDDVNLTPTQLRKWIVTYTAVPDGLLNFYGPVEQQIFNEGERWKGEYGFVNVTNKIFSDSLTVRTEIFNQTSLTSESAQITIKAPLPGDTTKFFVDVNTFNKAGVNDVNVYVNPKILPEQYFDNNLLQLSGYLRVLQEDIHPVLDVSIDGRYINNLDFVTSSPKIVIKVWDENKHVLKTDTTGMKVFLSYPCPSGTCDFTPILLTSEGIIWYPATTSEPFRIEFTPRNLANGVYTLRVIAQDGTNNSSGSEPYEIQFTVNAETTVSVAEPYPNPFSDNVYFKIVISGDELPSAFDIKLIDVNGKQVGHYGDYSKPNLHIGSNELTWDGRDPSGNLLPGGIYIYKMMLYIHDKVIQKVGKIVLVRTQ